MTLKELKTFIAKLPEGMEEFTVVNGEVGYLEEGNDDSVVYRVDKPIIALYVDEKEKEICFFHQTKEDLKAMSPDGDTKNI